MNPDPTGSLEEQVRALTARVWRMERTLRAHGIAAEEDQTFPGAEPASTQESAGPIAGPAANTAFPEPVPVQAAAPSFLPLTQQALKAETPSLETRIGSQWFNRVGILAMLIGVAWFLKFAFDNHWIGPLGRVLIGLVGGAALIAWSERFHKRGFAAFAYSLKAIGSGTLYLSLWAAFSVYALMPAWAAFALMIVVTGFNGFMAWIQDAELLALYAIAGGLGTPLLVSSGGNHEITLFAYLLILDCAVLVLVALRPWSRLLFSAFAGTALFVFGWWIAFYSSSQAGRTAFFLACFFLMFAFAPRLVRLRLTAEGSSSAWDQLALTILPLLNAALGFVAFYFLFDEGTRDWAGPWIAVMFAAFYLVLLRLPSRGVLQDNSALLSGLHLSAAVVFLTIAIPLKTQGRWLTIGWLVEGAVLMGLASRLRSLLLRGLAMICLALGLVALLVINPPASTTPFLNQRFGTYAVAIAAFAFTAWTAYLAQDDPASVPFMEWRSLAAESVLIANALTLLALGWEIHSYWWSLRWAGGDWTLFHDYRIYAQFTYSALFMVFGAALLGVGFWRNSAFLRWQALVLLALSIGKVFLWDVSELSRGFRIVSFFALGALLLAVSFAYQRDWLSLRNQRGQAS